MQGVVEPLLRTLCKMHDDGWIHRDIKPENIFLTELGEFRLGDFGLSINFDEEEPFHISGARHVPQNVSQMHKKVWSL